MPTRDLEIQIMRKGKPEGTLDMHADPDNIPGLQAILRGWLEGNGWSKGLWPQFSADVRLAGSSKRLRTVRS